MLIKCVLIICSLFFLDSYNQSYDSESAFSVTIEVYNLRNSSGIVWFALYNNNKVFPDENFESCFIKGESRIVGGKSTFIFYNIPKDIYAIAVFHDENENGKIDMGFIKPKEGIGFLNYKSVNVTNRPKFSKASFELAKDAKVTVKMNYL